MKKMLLFLCLLIAAVNVGANDYRIEISEDGHQTVIVDDKDQASMSMITNDVVPYNLTPDWSCDIRMQVGGLATGDLDGDADIDLAVGCYQSQSYPPYPDCRNFILFNEGDHLQSSPTWWTDDSSSTTEVRIADLNYDGFPDIFSANGGFAMSPSTIYYYGENESIDTQAGWYSNDNCWSTGAAAFDFDNDGDMDVATSNQGVNPDYDRPVHLFIADDGQLPSTPSWSSADEALSGSVAWGDYNGDGFYDLAVSKWVNWYSCVYRNNEGSLRPVASWRANNDDMQKGIGWSDINGDSYPELAIGASSMSTQLYGNNEGALSVSPVWESVNTFHGCQDLAWADVDGDGDEDLATVHFSNGHLRIYLNVDGQLETTPSWQYDSPASGTALTFGDINGDGAIDLIMGVSGSDCINVFYNLGPTSVKDVNPLPQQTSLGKNYPNPFNAETRISFHLEKPSSARIEIYDLQGRLANILADDFYMAGNYSVVWDGTDAFGNSLATGVYFYRLATDRETTTRRMVLLK